MNNLLIQILPTQIEWLTLEKFEKTNPSGHAHEVLVAKEKHGNDIEVINAWVFPKNNYTEYDLIRDDTRQNPIDKTKVLAIGLFSRYFMSRP